MSFLESVFKFLSSIFYSLAGVSPKKDEEVKIEEEIEKPEEPSESQALHDLILKKSPGIGPKMVKMAKDWFFHPEVTNLDYMVLVDFDYPETSPRMWVVDRKTGASEVFKVAHGAASDPDKDGRPTDFSNVSGSHQSSLGAMVTLAEYSSTKFKESMRLKGLQPGLNDKVLERAVVFHSSDYVNDVKGGLIGDSWGCFAVSLATAQRIIGLIDDGALLFAYHKSLDKTPKVDGGTPSLEKAVKLIKKFEGFYANTYYDPVGILTIGYGTIAYPNGQKVKMGDFVTEAKASEYLQLHIEKDILPAMSELIKVTLTENQFSALVSFVYNLGSGNLKKSTLLKKLNEEDYLGAANEFPKWVKAGGKTLQGLVNRREAEKALFLEV